MSENDISEKPSNKSLSYKIPDDAQHKVLILASVLLYTSYVAAKNLYGAEIVEIMSYFKISKVTASTATSVGFITYAVSQIILAKIFPKLNIIRFVIISSVISVFLIVLIPFCTNIYQIWVIYGIIGITLTGIYPACLSVIGKYIPAKLLPKSTILLGSGFAIAFIMDYVFGAAFVKFFSWKTGFFVFGILLLFAAVFFCFAVSASQKRFGTQNRKAETVKKGFILDNTDFKTVFWFVFFVSLLGLLANGIYYAVANWVTNLMSDEFGLSSSFSIFLTVFIPIGACIGPVVQSKLCMGRLYWNVFITFLIISLSISLLLFFIYKVNLVVTLLLYVVLIIMLRGAANLLGMEIPMKYRRKFDSGSLGSIINAFSCVGASAGPLFAGSIIDGSGIKVYYLFIGAFIVLSLAITILGKNFSIKHNQ